jgi:hypothetical protein
VTHASVVLLASRDLPGPVIFLIVIVVAVFIAYSILQNKAFRGTLIRVAERTGGTFVEGGWFSTDSLELKVAGYPARVEFYGGSKNSSPYSRVVVSLGRASPGYLHILEHGFGQSFLQMFGAQDLEIGDPDFDRAYVIKATPAVLATRLFNPQRRREGIRAVLQLHGYSHPTFDLDSSSATVMVRQLLRTENDLLLLINAAKEFVAFVLPPAEPAGVVLGELKVTPDGQCPVCGTSLREALVRCEMCRTPHHEQCWTYMGRCSTYGCRGKRSVA